MSKKPKEPLVRCSGTMTEPQFLSWIRSALRSKSLRWKPRTDALLAARRDYKGPNKRQKYEYKCAICGGYFKADDVVVDHYPKAAGSILCVADIGEFCNNLYCEVSNLRVLCCADHDVYTLQQKNPGMTFEEAVFQKDVNMVCRESVKNVKEFCYAYGYTDAQLTNSDKRRKIVEKILKEHSK